MSKTRKRPCSICRRWFEPDARVGARQRACSAPACQRARHHRSDQAWHARNLDYDRERRLQQKLANAKEAAAAAPAPSPPARGALRGLPLATVQDEWSLKERVVLEELLRHLMRWAQDEMKLQAFRILGDFRKVLPRAAQDETAPGGPSP